MNDRRGHRKLRLTSRKHFKPKPKRCGNVQEKTSTPAEDEELLDFNISVPLTAYTDASVNSVRVLHNRLKSCAVVPSDIVARWTDKLKNGKLSIYQVQSFEHGPEVILSITVEEKFSWLLFFRRQLVNPACCSILRTTPSELDSVLKVKNLMETLCMADICEGNPDERFLLLPNVHKGTMKDKTGTEIIAQVDSSMTGVSSIYHVNCEVLIESTSLTKRCSNCKKHRQTLSAMVSRQQRMESSNASSCQSRSDPSSHTGYAYLKTPEKDERLRRLHKDNRKLNLRIKCLEKKLTSATVQDGVTLTDELHSDFKEISSENTNKIHSSHSADSLARLFWDQQMKASQFKKSTSMKWHPLFIKWCLYLRHLSGKSYELLRSSGCIKLPSQSTLRDYTHCIPSGIGFSTEVDQNLVDVAFLSNELNKYVFLIMDEVHIKRDLVYDKHEGCLIGFMNLGEINNQLIEFECALAADQESTQPTLASTMLVLMVRGLFCKLNYPYAQFACSDVSGGLLFDPVWKAVARLEKLGFYVLGLSCDGASPNRRFWKLHSKSNDELTYKVLNPFANNGRQFYFISDPPHLLKTIRNSFYNSKRKLWCNGKEISWQHVLDFYHKDTAEGRGLRLVPKLKYEHLHLTSFSKMQVDLAAQVMSESVACALEHTGGKEVEETVKFIRMIDKFFDTLNVTNLVTGKKKRKLFQSPYTSGNDFRVKWLTDEFIPYLNEWEGSVKKRRKFSPQSKSMMLLAKETRNGINITVKSFVELVDYIFKIPGVKFFLSERLSQDPLENFFGCQRQRGRTSENPNVQEFCKNTQALRVINSVCGTVAKGNCCGRKQSIDLQKENKPLAKRRRHREKKLKNDRISKDCADALTASIPTEEGSNDHLLSAGEDGLSELSSDEMVIISDNTDEESQLTEVLDKTAVVVGNKATISHENTPLKISDSFATLVAQQVSKCDESVAESSAEITDQFLASSKSMTINSYHIRRHSAESRFFLNTLQEEMINKVLGPGAPDERITNGYGIVLRRQDFWTLNSRNWLNDQVINFFMHLIMERFNDIYTYSTFFYPKLQKDGYLAVCQWNRGVNIFSKRLLLFPVYLEGGAHWCLAAINIAKKTITYLDSLKNENSVCLKVLQEYLIQESQGSVFHSAVSYSNHQKNIPEQTNSFDCGVFICTYALYLAENTAFDFAQDDMPSIRKQMAFQLLSKKL